MNILFVHSSSELYGSDKSLLNIVKNIDKAKYKVHVILPYSGPLVDEMTKIPDIQVQIYEVAVLRRKNLSIRGFSQYIKKFVLSYKYLKKYIINYNINVLDTNTAVIFPGAIAARSCGIKNVWHVREIIESKLENKVISFVINKYADLVVFNSKATAKALNINEKKKCIVYNAVAEKSEDPTFLDINSAVGMAGRINRWKGQKLFIDAAEIVNKSMPEITFKIAGAPYTGEEHLNDELIQYIKEKGMQDIVVLLGQVNDMTKFYNNIDLFVLPSKQPEPFGLVVIEAMEHSLPVIATNHGGPVEIISDGIDGYLVDYNQSGDMAKRIIELMSNENKRIQMGRNGKKKRTEQFSIFAMVRRLEEIFEEVLHT